MFQSVDDPAVRQHDQSESKQAVQYRAMECGLKGKPLEYLSVERNPTLTVDLADLCSNQYSLSLRKLHVSRSQIVGQFGLRGLRWHDPLYERLRELVMRSSLNSLTMACHSGHQGRRRHIQYLRNGTVITDDPGTIVVE